uniref:Uncharacterized protein n=1 Tax=Rhizophora mucronata TaxID=61149 RepID=A0A2P2ISN4_RHIMU
MSLELRRMLQARHILAQFKLKSSQTRIFCTNTTKPIDKNNGRSKKVESNVSKYNEMYQQLDKLDFMTAAKILFSESPKKKKFGYYFIFALFSDLIWVFLLG